MTAPTEAGHPGPTQPVVDHGLYDDAQREDEGAERDVRRPGRGPTEWSGPERSARTPSTTTPANAAQAGLTPNARGHHEAHQGEADHDQREHGYVGRLADRCSVAAAPRSRRKNQRNTRVLQADCDQPGQRHHEVNRRNDSPEAANASRLVRLETGSSKDAELARWAWRRRGAWAGHQRRRPSQTPPA